jgi:GMP synthase-like glutamine amidotransferase
VSVMPVANHVPPLPCPSVASDQAMIEARTSAGPPSHRLRVGLLQCGTIPADLDPPAGDYPEVWGSYLGPLGIDLVTYDVVEHAPPSPDAEAAWLVSGSASSTYEPLAWIPPMEAFLRDVVASGIPLVAVCFGHQLLAQALGGRVARADAGWGVGAHAYEVVGDPPPWMEPRPDGPVRLIASHQDQVVELPQGAEVWARTEHCPVAGFTLGSSALAIQPHPEFTAVLSQALVSRRRPVIGDERADEALRSFGEPLHRDQVASWIVSFLRGAAATAPAAEGRAVSQPGRAAPPG